MYTVNQGPSKLVAKTRTGLSQNYDKIETIRKIKVNNAQQSSRKSGGGSSGSSSTGQLSNSDNGMDINCAKPVFQQYRRSNSNRSNSLYKNGTVRIACFKDEEPQPVPSPQYEELIRYIRDSWNVLSVPEQDDATETQTTTAPTKGSASPSSSSSLSSSSSTHRTSSASSSESIRRNGRKNGFNANKKVIYHNDPPSPALDDFGPFDLESWWGRRLFNNITKSL